MKGTWRQALISFFSPILAVLVLRWAVFEPFIIPSGSMIPTLWIHDHIVVKKYSFGMHFPFSDSWLFQWRNPKRGEVIVFKYPKSPDTYYIKRLIGLPGDHIRVNSREVWVNDKKLQRQSLTSDPNDSTDAYLSDGLKFDKFLEKNDESEYVIRHLADVENDSSSDLNSDTNAKLNSSRFGEERTFEVPEHEYFFMGDNRDQSSDSRVWGFVPEKYLVGTASFVWLSCDQMLESANFACDPRTIRWKRLFQIVR